MYRVHVYNEKIIFIHFFFAIFRSWKFIKIWILILTYVVNLNKLINK